MTLSRLPKLRCLNNKPAAATRADNRVLAIHVYSSMAAMATVETLPAERRANPLKSFITGGFGGTCSVLSGHPLDTIKVRLQTMPQPLMGQLPLYTGSLDCAAKTIRNEGVRGLYRGMSAPLVAVAPMYALDFALYAADECLTNYRL